MADVDPNTTHDSTGGEAPEIRRKTRPQPRGKRAPLPAPRPEMHPPKLPTREKLPTPDDSDDNEETTPKLSPRPRPVPRPPAPSHERDESGQQQQQQQHQHPDLPQRTPPKTQPRPRMAAKPPPENEDSDSSVSPESGTMKSPPTAPKPAPRPRGPVKKQQQRKVERVEENDNDDDDGDDEAPKIPTRGPKTQPGENSASKPPPPPRMPGKRQPRRPGEEETEDNNEEDSEEQHNEAPKMPSRGPKGQPTPRPRTVSKLQQRKVEERNIEQNENEEQQEQEEQEQEDEAPKMPSRGPKGQPAQRPRTVSKLQQRKVEERSNEQAEDASNNENDNNESSEDGGDDTANGDSNQDAPPVTPPRKGMQSPQNNNIQEPPTLSAPPPLAPPLPIHGRKVQQKRSAFSRARKVQKGSSSTTAEDGIEKPPSPLSPRRNTASVDQTMVAKQQPQSPKRETGKRSTVNASSKSSASNVGAAIATPTSSVTSTTAANTSSSSSSSSHKKSSSSSKDHSKKESSSSSSSHKKRKHHHKLKEEEDDVIAEPLFFDPDGSESLLSIIGRLDTNSSGRLIKKMKELNNIKRKISTGSKRNFLVEGDLAGLDKKIAVLIRNRISLDEILSSKGDITENLKELTVLIKDPSQREMYGRMFYLLQRHPEYMAHLAGSVKLAEIDPLLQTVMFTLYGNQYEEDEEHLLLTMFRTVMAEELNKASGINELFRSNSALTRMLTTYTRRSAGQQFLKTTFKSILTEIVSDSEMNLEITPNKVFDEYVNDYEVRNGQPYEGEKKLPTEECAKMPFIQEIIRPRIPIIERYISKFIDQYERNLNLVPYGIRWICKQVKLIVLEKWPDTDWRQVCTMIGGFFVLRFINPAIITPAAYMILDQTPGPTARRNLTVLAKIQQNLSNCTRFSDVKEPYMTPLNYIFDKHSDRFLHFLDSLTEVDDLDHHLSLDKYVYLTKFTKDQIITISLNEMYLIHNLLLKYRSSLVTPEEQPSGGEEDPLLKILTLMPEAPAQLPRAENFEMELKLIAPEAKEGFGDEQLKQVAPERLFSETKYYLFNVIRKLPTGMKLKNDLVIPLLNQISEILTTGSGSSSSTTKHLVANIKKIVSNLHQLEALEVTSESDNFLILRQDLSNDITNISSRIKRVEGDISRLKAVLKAIDDQYKNAQAQIDTYRQYLDNVRQTVSGSSGGKGSSSSGGSSASGPSSISSAATTKKEKEKDPRYVTVSFSSLLKDKIIVNTPPSLASEKLSNISVQFFMVSPGIFDVSIFVGGQEKAKEKMLLDELLESQANGHQTETTEAMEYNVNLMIYFINKKFVIKAHK